MRAKHSADETDDSAINQDSLLDPHNVLCEHMKTEEITEKKQEAIGSFSR